MAQKINDSLFLNKAGILEAKYGPWASIQEMLTEVAVEYRTPGLTFGIKDIDNRVTEYWFQGGVLEEHIEPKYDNSYDSSWIRKPVKEAVEDLPLSPQEGDRYLHGVIIKEYVNAAWKDIVGGTGATLIDGMSVVVNAYPNWPNMIFIYHASTQEWLPFIPTQNVPTEDINITKIFQLHFVTPLDNVYKITMNDDGTINILPE